MPESIGPYEIKGELGRGAMAVVYRAWDPSLQREVAIKEPFRSSQMPGWLASELDSRFIIESQAAARLNHPNIITVYAADKYNGRSAMVMELLEGSTLSELIDHKQLTPERIYSIWTQLLDALIYAHSMGVVHRDIKPDNIFVTSHDLVKLTDFGVAHMESNTPGDYAQVIAGSPGYMSPEQIKGEPADARSDLFGFSVIAYETLALTNPFGATEGLTREEIFLRTQASEALPGFEGFPQLSAVIARGMKSRPEDRWQSGKQFKSALSNAMDHERYSFMAHRRGKAFAYKAQENRETATPLSSRKISLGENKNTLLVVLLLFMALAALIGIMAGNAVVIMASFIALAVFGAIWGVSYYRDKLDKGEVKLPDLSNIRLVDSLDFSTPEALLMPSARQITAKVTSPFGDTSIEQFTVPITIGRGQTLGNYLIQDESVSARHLNLEVQGNTIRASDAGSMNGTFMDDERMEDSRPLRVGSKISMGNTTIEILEL